MNAPATTAVHSSHIAQTLQSTPEHVQNLMQIMMGMWASQAIGTLARLRVFDAIMEGKTTPLEISRALGLDAAALSRTLRAAAMLGMLREVGSKHFELTPMGALLCSNTPNSMRALLDAETAPGHWLPWGTLDECVRCGQTLAHETLGHANLWDYYAAHPAEGKAFSEGMSGLSAAAIGAISAVWHPPAAARVVDVGGAHGAFLSWVLSQLPNARGQILDLPHVIETARASINDSPLAGRVDFTTGDFFTDIPAGADLYLLKHIVHDWDDEQARTILENIRRAMSPGGTLAIVEMLIPEDGTPSPAILLDLNMLVMLPGRERTLGEMRELCSSVGLAITRVVSTPSPFSLMEARIA
jgi:hypothetical protein